MAEFKIGDLVFLRSNTSYNIKDKNIHILTDKLSNKIIKGKNYQIIEALLTYNPDC